MIKAISEELAGTDKAVATLNDRLSKAEQEISELKPNVFTDDGFARFGLLQREIAQLKDRLTHGTDDIAEPREVWTDRQLSKIGAALTETTERVVRLEGQTAFEAREDDTRIKELDIRLKGWMTHCENQERRLDSLEILNRELRNQVAQLMIRLAAYGVPEHGVMTAKMESYPREVNAIDVDFSPPIGGIVDAAQAEVRRKGLSAEADKALENAEHRVRKALKDMGWHENAPVSETVIDALHGR